MWLEGRDKLKKNHLIWTRTIDLPACSIVPQPITLPRARWKAWELLKTGIFDYFINIVILLQLGVHPVAVELTLIQIKRVYDIREQYKTKYFTEKGTHSANPNI
jgi:hypothetical protein